MAQEETMQQSPFYEQLRQRHFQECHKSLTPRVPMFALEATPIA